MGSWLQPAPEERRPYIILQEKVKAWRKANKTNIVLVADFYLLLFLTPEIIPS